MDPNLQVTMEITEVALTPVDGMSMDEAIEKVKALGHTITRIDGRDIYIEHKEN